MGSKLKWLSRGAVVISLFLMNTVQGADRPNVIVILADDLGWMDVASNAARVKNVKPEACYYETPHIDQLAAQGMTFTQAYSAALCSPARAALLTGQYPGRFGFLTASGGTSGSYQSASMTPPEGCHIYDRKISPLSKTHPAQGYIGSGFTYLLQSGQPQDEYDAITIPEVLKGYRSAMVGKWHLGAHGIEGYQPKDQGFEELAYTDAGGSPYFDWREGFTRPGEDLGFDYLTDDLTERAVRFIRECDQNREPFFLYFPELAVHAKRQAKQEDLDYFEKKPTRGWNGHSMPEYAGVLRGLDNSVGRVVEELNKLGIAENTLLMFMSDNGGINRDTATSNLPLREGKAALYEGGIRVPFIAYWPGKIKPNTFCDQPIGVEDIFPTILSLVGQEKDLETLKHDGQSILPLLADPENKAKQYTRDTFFWYKAGGGYSSKTGKISPAPGSSIRKGDYKLMYHDQGYLELYNLANDLEEKNDLSEKMPEKTQELFRALDGMINEVVPNKYQRKPNPLYDPKMAAAIKAKPYRNLRNLPVEEVSEKERQAAKRRDWTVTSKGKKKGGKKKGKKK